MADPKANEKQGYHPFADIAGTWGSFEVWWKDSPNENDQPGWYWWACFPSCMPDGEPSGPFASSQEAYHNAQEGA